MRYAFALFFTVSCACTGEEWQPGISAFGFTEKRRECTYDMGKGKIRHQESLLFRPLTGIGNEVGHFTSEPTTPPPARGVFMFRGYKLVGDTGAAALVRMTWDADKTKTDEILTIPFIDGKATLVHMWMSSPETLVISRSPQPGFYRVEHRTPPPER